MVDPSGTASDVADLMSHRAEILACLLEEPREKRELENQIDASRSTLDRAVRELEASRLLSYENGKYTLTLMGDRLTRNFFEFLERVDTASTLEPFLEHIPNEQFSLDLRWFSDADLFVPTTKNPYAMVNRHVKLVRNRDQIRGMLPFVALHAHESAHENIVETGAEAELVVEEDVHTVLTSNPEFEVLTQEMLATGRFDLHIHEEPIPYCIVIFDNDTVHIAVDNGGEPQALVEATHENVLTWAQEVLADYIHQSRLLTQTGRKSRESPDHA